MKKKNNQILIAILTLGLGIYFCAYAFLSQSYVHAAEEEQESDFEIMGELFRSIFGAADSEEIDPAAEEEIRRRMEAGESLEGFDPDDPSTWGSSGEGGEFEEDGDSCTTTRTTNNFGEAVAEKASEYINTFKRTYDDDSTDDTDESIGLCGVFVSEVYQQMGVNFPIGNLTGHTKDWCSQAKNAFSSSDWDVIRVQDDGEITDDDIELGDIVLYGQPDDGSTCSIRNSNGSCNRSEATNVKQCADKCPGDYLISEQNDAAWRGHAGIVGRKNAGGYYDYQQGHNIKLNDENKPVQCRIRYIGAERDEYDEVEEECEPGSSQSRSSNFNGHFCQCDPRWQSKGDKCMCNAGCGLNSIAGIMQHLGINETPTQVRNALEKRGTWNCNVGLYPYDSINSDYFASKGLKAGPNISRGGLDLIKAKRFIDEGAVILCSSVSLYHVFFVSDVDVENRTITTHDSWKGCGSGNAMPPPRRVSAPYNKASYCDKYAYPIMRIRSPNVAHSQKEQ